MKNLLNVSKIILIFLVIVEIIFIPNYSKAYSAVEPLEEIEPDVAGVIGDVEVSYTEAESNISPMLELIGTILGFLQVLSALVSVVVIALTGFRYIVEDTPDLRKELKEKMLPIIIGMVLIFGAVSITNFILGLAG